MNDSSDESLGRLSVVATPIGNMGDMTFRGLWVLKEANCIYAEDTRVTLKLLNHYGLKKPLFRLDAAVEGKKAREVIDRLEAGERVAYVSDAGTPGISDPAARLVAAVREALPGAKIEAVPGASSLTAALSISGIQADEFLFLGFLPHKKGRQTALREIAASERVVVLFESPHRILKLLKELGSAAPEKRVTVAKEITKLHEEVIVGMPQAVGDALAKSGKARGEFVVVIQPSGRAH